MSRMSYRWTAAEWQQSYRERMSNLRLLSVLNLVALAAAFVIPTDAHAGFDPRAFIPMGMLAINFALTYVFLADVGEGWATGLACGVMFGVAMLGCCIAADSHTSPLYPFAAAMGVAVLFYEYARGHYSHQLALVVAGNEHGGRRRRG
jgi:hypothetical protein